MRRPALLALAALVLLAQPAAAAPDCEGGPFASRTLASDQGTLESAIVHPNGSLYFTNEAALLRMDKPGAKPVAITEAEEPGGLAIEPDGTIVMGVGNTASNGTVGDQTGPSSLIRIDPVTGESEPYAAGLSMGNGVDRGPDGAIYASNDFGSNIDRIVNGETERGWATVQSGNGLQVDSTGKWLYVNQTFEPAAIQRVEIANPDNVTPFAVAPPEDMSAGFDGMDRDPVDNLYVAANGAGSIWKVTPQAEMCVLLRGLPPFPDGPSAVAVGLYGTPFPPENLYVVAFNGDVTEIAGVAELGAVSKLRLSVRPRRATVGKRTRFRARVKADGEPLEGVIVRLARRRAITDERGKAVLQRKFKRAGKRRARASKGGYRSARKRVRVLAR